MCPCAWMEPAKFVFLRRPTGASYTRYLSHFGGSFKGPDVPRAGSETWESTAEVPVHHISLCSTTGSSRIRLAHLVLTSVRMEHHGPIRKSSTLLPVGQRERPFLGGVPRVPHSSANSGRLWEYE